MGISDRCRAEGETTTYLSLSSEMIVNVLPELPITTPTLFHSPRVVVTFGLYFGQFILRPHHPWFWQRPIGKMHKFSLRHNLVGYPILLRTQEDAVVLSAEFPGDQTILLVGENHGNIPIALIQDLHVVSGLVQTKVHLPVNCRAGGFLQSHEFVI